MTEKVPSAFEWTISTLPEIQNIVICYMLWISDENAEKHIKRSRVHWSNYIVEYDKPIATEFIFACSIPKSPCLCTVDQFKELGHGLLWCRAESQEKYLAYISCGMALSVGWISCDMTVRYCTKHHPSHV